MPEQEDMKCGQYIGTYGKFLSTFLKNFTYTNNLNLAPFANEINKKRRSKAEWARQLFSNTQLQFLDAFGDKPCCLEQLLIRDQNVWDQPCTVTKFS